ncbi:MAG: EutN/CcmL family microcompartment protein [Spirochaetaceae bacterium]|nr:MAG: EutN/CcmL family microcompartment protein [Spirochaetaceae bacterium]
MILGRVIGSVVSTVKLDVLVGYKLLMVQPVDPQGKDAGSLTLALDVVQAGIGDTVLVLEEGNSGRMIVGNPMAPIRTIIVGIVDEVNIGGEG